MNQEPKVVGGLVSESLRGLITRQVEDHALVIWYDPEKHYGNVAETLTLPKTSIAQYHGSFFQLRREIEPLLNDLHPPRLLVYVPKHQGETDHALAELEAAGVVVQPGQQPPNRNTRLSLIFGTSNAQETALSFVASSRFDADIEKRSATGELADLLRTTLECDLPGKAPLSEMRDRLARHVLLTDLVVGLGSSLPASLSSLKVASALAARDACKDLTRTWRLRRDVRDSYVTAARKIEQESSLGACPGISIQVTSMDDQSVQIASIRSQCSFAPIPAA